MTGTEPKDPQLDSLPLLSLPTSRPWLLQTVSYPILRISCPFPPYLFPPAPTLQERWDDGNMYDLERVKIWECFTRNDQF